MGMSLNEIKLRKLELQRYRRKNNPEILSAIK